MDSDLFPLPCSELEKAKELVKREQQRQKIKATIGREERRKTKVDDGRHWGLRRGREGLG